MQGVKRLQPPHFASHPLPLAPPISASFFLLAPAPVPEYVQSYLPYLLPAPLPAPHYLSSVVSSTSLFVWSLNLE